MNQKFCVGLVEKFLGRSLSKEDMELAEKNLDLQWYSSNQTDFSIYGNNETLPWLARHQQRALAYIKNLSKFLEANPQYSKNTIYEEGAGLGFISLYLAQKFPDSKIIASNFAGVQFDFCRFLHSQYPLPNLHFVEEGQRTKADILIAFEVFEHLKNPLEFFYLLEKNIDPNIIVDSSSFSVPSPGHFSEYQFGDKIVTGYPHKTAARLFYKDIKQRFNSAPVKFWNNRPRVWIKKEIEG